jgi:hypothetical protein
MLRGNGKRKMLYLPAPARGDRLPDRLQGRGATAGRSAKETRAAGDHTRSGSSERLSYRGQMYRADWCAASEMRPLAITRGGWAPPRARRTPFPQNLFWGLLWLVSAAVMAVSRGFRHTGATGREEAGERRWAACRTGGLHTAALSGGEGAVMVWKLVDWLMRWVEPWSDWHDPDWKR